MSATMVHDNKKFVSVTEAAKIIGVTTGRVRQLLLSEEMRGEKLSQNVWLIERKEAELFAKTQHKVGRPRTSKNS